ncbi:MAG: efflux RND transporter permease subunit [Bacillota bacterium]|nr:efflux RND transporter permease subunit [Bacillota bacterium]
MNRFTKFSLRNSFIILLIIVMIAVGGVYSTKSIKMESMPDINIPVITVVTVYPGAAPEDVAESLSRPLQKSISGVKGIKDVKTISNENISMVVAEFDYSQDMDKAEKDVQDAVNKVTVPDKSQKPTVSRISFGSFPVMTYTIDSNMNVQDLTKFVDDKLKPKIAGVQGVSNADIQGTNSNKIYIKLDDQKLKDNNLTASDIKTALTSNNVSFPTGQVNVNDETLPVRVSKQVVTIDDIKAIPIVVMPNQTQIMKDAFGKIGDGMGQLGSAVGQLGQGMGQLGSAVGQLGQGMGQMGQSMGQIGQMTGGNTQAIAILNEIQQLEAGILKEQTDIEQTSAKLQADMAKLEVVQNQAKADENKDADTKAKDKKAVDDAQNVVNTDKAELTKEQTTIAQYQAGLSGAQQAFNKIMNDQMQLGQAMANAQKSQASSSSPTQQSTNTQASTSSKTTTSSTNATPDISIKTVFLKDLADVSSEPGDQTLYTRSNLKNGVLLSVYKTDDANTVEVSKNVRAALDEIAKSNKDVKFNLINDSADYVKTSVDGMVREGVLGALFAIIVIALFLKELRATLIAIVSIPLSILIALILLPRFNITLNTMSLAGIAVAVGRIVDDSIVVIENIYRRITEGKLPKEELVETAAKEVSSAITSSTITTVAVFLPLGMVSGIIGKIFVPFAFTVVICILASLLVAITVVPVMSKYMLLNKKVKHVEKEGALARAYKKVLNGALNHRFIVLGLSLVLLVASYGLVNKVGIQFLPSETASILNGKLSMPAGTSIEKTNEEALKFEKYLNSRNDVKTIASSIGDNSGTSTVGNLQGSNAASFTIVLKDNIDKDKVAQEIMDKAKEMSTDTISFTVTPQSTTGASSDKVSVIINGNNIDDITKAANKVTDVLKSMSSLSNVTNNLAAKKPEISVVIDSKKAADKGITPMIAAGIVRSAISYDNVMTVKDGNKDVQVLMGYDNKDINSLDKVKAIKIQAMGDPVTLADIADVKIADGPVSISELDGNQYANVSADIKGKDTSKITTEAMNKIDAVKSSLPSGVTYSENGSSKDIQEGFSQMGLAMAAAIFMVYIVMVLAFGEAKAPFAILFSLPFAAVGAIFALFITKQPLTMSGMIGMLMLIGIVVTNAIVLVDRVQTNRHNGMSVREALLEAGSVRLRPIFMTAIATIMALLPLALGFSEGALISQGLGVVVIGGLVVSTMLTLVIVPIIYSILERDK